jgi:hypothetical protein
MQVANHSATLARGGHCQSALSAEPRRHCVCVAHRHDAHLAPETVGHQSRQPADTSRSRLPQIVTASSISRSATTQASTGFAATHAPKDLDSCDLASCSIPAPIGAVVRGAVPVTVCITQGTQRSDLDRFDKGRRPDELRKLDRTPAFKRLGITQNRQRLQGLTGSPFLGGLLSQCPRTMPFNNRMGGGTRRV